MYHRLESCMAVVFWTLPARSVFSGRPDLAVYSPYRSNKMPNEAICGPSRAHGQKSRHSQRVQVPSKEVLRSLFTPKSHPHEVPRDPLGLAFHGFVVSSGFPEALSDAFQRLFGESQSKPIGAKVVEPGPSNYKKGTPPSCWGKNPLES